MKITCNVHPDVILCSEGRNYTRRYSHYGNYGGGGRTIEPIPHKIIPVHGLPTVFITSLPLRELNLLSAPPGKLLRDAAAEKWSRSVDALFQDLAGQGISRKSVTSRKPGLTCAVIGQMFNPHAIGRDFCFGWVSDLELVLAVLSRTVAGIYFAEREPDFSWETLFTPGLLVDEDITGMNIPTRFWQTS